MYAEITVTDFITSMKNVSREIIAEAWEGAYAPDTLRAYKSDLDIYEYWCQKNGLDRIPIHTENLIKFINDQAVHVGAETIRRRLVAVARLHAIHELDNPSKSEWVRLALRKVKRSRPTRPKQALGLTEDLRDRLIAACPDNVIGLRNRALIAVGYDTLCRRSELVGLNVDDIQPRTAGGARILVRRAKNDPFGRGRLASISARGFEFLQNWLNKAELNNGPLFRIVYQQKVGQRAIGPDQVGRILKDVGKAAGLEPSQIAGLSGHSMRVGAAQDLMIEGRNILQIMHAGGWKSINIVSRYCESADFNVWETRN